jgi:hypothetical protein
METLVKRALPAAAPSRSVKAIERYAQAFEARIEVVLSHRQKKKSQRSTQPLVQLIAAASGRINLHSSLALRVFSLERQVEAFRALQPDWDTYGALPIQEVAIRQARRLLHLLSMQLTGARPLSIHVFPMRDGGVQIEIDGDEMEMEVEVHPDGTEDYLVFNPEGQLLPTRNTLTSALRQFANPLQMFQVG